MQESPEVNAVIQKIANRTMFCSVAGGGISYLIARWGWQRGWMIRPGALRSWTCDEEAVSCS